jgi:putative CRISPR-associated protein (TIGR02619 family)
MPRVIVSPCGTSLLTNGTDESLRKLLIKISNYKEVDFSQEEKKIVDKHCVQRKQEIHNADISKARQLSAELNGIITYRDMDCGSEFSKSDHYIILATDTYLGGITAKFAVDWLKGQSLKATEKVIQDLSTKDIDSFRAAMSEIVRWCDEELEKQYPKPTWKIIFNLTGGFKSVNGFLQTLAMFYADESIYIFEAGGQLLKIPRLPIQLDPEAEIGENLLIFRRLAVLMEQLPFEECQDISDTLLDHLDAYVSLSEWGKLIWQKSWKRYYSEELLSPLSSRLKYSNRFEQVAKSLSRDRLLIINERLDQISRYLETNRSYNPPTLDLKPLRGRPFKGKLSPEPTHECDAWSDRDAKRIYGHFDGKVYIVDDLGKKLQ